MWKIAYEMPENKDYANTIVFAAKELLRYLNAACPDKDLMLLELLNGESPVDNTILLSVCDFSYKDKSKNSVLDDAVDISVSGTNGHISGPNARSVLIGVYRFLSEIGFGFLRPGEETIPDIKPQNINVNINEEASYRHRAYCIEGSTSYTHIEKLIDWLPKIGMNGYFAQFFVPYAFYSSWYEHRHNPTLESQHISENDVLGMVRAAIREIKKRGILYHAVGHGWNCAPFGLDGNSWDPSEESFIPEQSRQYLAQIQGERKLHRNTPIYTNLCYSNKTVQKTIVNAIADYCENHPEIDYLHFWLGDDINNHCECDECKKGRPADFYAAMLNAVDMELTKRNISTKIVFLIYMDLLWTPQYETLQNSERFVLMFAPITRSYTVSFASKIEEAEGLGIPEYQRNHIIMPSNPAQNIAHLRQWQKAYSGDSFIFEYHMLWDYNKDPGCMKSTRIVWEDMRALYNMKLNGNVSCQVSRPFFPNAVCMFTMAQTLWNRDLDYDSIVNGYLKITYGDGYEKVRAYLEKISELFDPAYIRLEKPLINAEQAQKFLEIDNTVNEFLPCVENGITKNLKQADEWKNLLLHAKYCKLFAALLYRMAIGNDPQKEQCFAQLKNWMYKNEMELYDIFDLDLWDVTITRFVQGKHYFNTDIAQNEK